MAWTNVYTCLCMQANRLKHVRTYLIRYRSGGTPYILRNLRCVPDCGPLSEEAVPASAPATSRLFVLLVTTRWWVLTDNTSFVDGLDRQMDGLGGQPAFTGFFLFLFVSILLTMAGN